MSEGSSSGGLKQFFVPALVIVSIGLAFFSGTLWQKLENVKKADETQLSGTPELIAEEVTLDTIKGLFDKDLIKFGNAENKLIFVEIADPSCPYCHIADGNNAELAASAGTNFKYLSDGGTYVPPGAKIEELVKENKASYVYVYYPGHGNGEMGMKSLYCANEKGKFWEAKKLIMSNNGYTLVNTTVKNDKNQASVVAEFLKGVVDYEFMKSCLESDRYDARLESDQQVALSLNIQGTPTFWINANDFPGAYSFTDMEEIVNSFLD